MLKMLRKLLPFLDSFLELNYHERLKFILLAGMFACGIACHGLFRLFKRLVFFQLIGISYQPYTKLLAALIFFPTMYLYTLLIDRVKRETIVYTIFIGYALSCFILAYLLLDPILGLPNTEAGSHRILGWLFYIIMDLFPGLMATTIWSYASAINTPQTASRGYNFIIVASRISGIISSGATYYFLNKSLNPILSIPFIITICGILLLLGSIFMFCIPTFIPTTSLEGYEPEAFARTEELKNAASDKNHLSFFEKIIHSLKKTFEGLRLLISNPYVFGIFGIAYSFEIIRAILDYQFQFMRAIENNNSFIFPGLFMLYFNTLFQFVGLFVALFALSPLLKKYGLRFCLMLTPLITIALIISLFAYQSVFFIVTIMIIILGIESGFGDPISGMLFIPTSHNIKYKANAWIEFASRSFARTSSIRIAIPSIQAAYFSMAFCNLFSLLVAVVWLILAYLVGRKYELAVKNNRIIS